MKVGDYVRSSWGTISKITEYTPYEDDECFGITLEDGTNTFYKHQWQFDNDYKSSPNIIDLIEVGDIVITPLGEIIRPTSSNVDELKDYWKITRNPIKSIVTHEQFEQMEYRIKENRK